MKQENSTGAKLMKKIKDNPIVMLLLAASVIVGLTRDNFFSWNNLGNLGGNTAIRFLIALGVSGCLITRGTDLSAGRQVGLAACVAGLLAQKEGYSGKLIPWLPEMNLFLILLIVLVIGALVGLLNGVIITKLGVPPFIATLGTQTVVYGICLIGTDAQPIGGFQKGFIQLAISRINLPGGMYIPWIFMISALFGVLFRVMYNKTVYGKNVYAIGGNPVAARVSGVSTSGTIITVYMIAGLMYALAGYLLAAKSGGASASMGQGYELEAIAGCTIGGVSTTGGVGRVEGILVGVLVFELLKIILQFLGVNPYFNYVAQGLVIVAAVALDLRKNLQKK